MKFLCTLCLMVLFFTAPAQAESFSLPTLHSISINLGNNTPNQNPTTSSTCTTNLHPSCMPASAPKSAATAQSADDTAQSQYLYCNLKGVIEGNIGTLVGLALALFGLLQFTVQGKTYGLINLLLGVLLTLSPSIYVSFMKGLRTTFSGVEGQAVSPPNCSGSSTS